MLKKSPSLVSIFIVFSLIFLIQTILNSKVFEYQEDSTSFNFRILSLRQVVVDATRWNPESDNLYIDDRIVFISIGEFLFRNINYRNINYKSFDFHPVIVNSRNLYHYKIGYFSQTELSKSTIQLRSKIDKDGKLCLDRWYDRRSSGIGRLCCVFQPYKTEIWYRCRLKS